jgi:hypothetical protein
VVAVANQVHHHPLGFISPLRYRLLGTGAATSWRRLASGPGPHRLHELPDNSLGKFWRLQTVDV